MIYSIFCVCMIEFYMKKLLIIIIVILNLNSTELISPIPTDIDYNIDKALLGKKLFHDPRLSSDNTISCASCHDIKGGGDDDREVSLGVGDKKGNLNSPTILNAKFNLSQFWDGRARGLKEQALGPIHNPVEMNNNFNNIIEDLENDEYYKEAFKIYESGITQDNIVDSIVEFEKALTTPQSRFDQYLLGNEDILSKDEKEGFELFKDYGCISCHNGINIGGNLYQKMGVMKEYLPDSSDLGRYNITKKEEDKYYFKVPTLRNIEQTAPYLHDGSRSNLTDVIKVMIEYQVGITPNDEDIEKIKSFLKTLNGKIPIIMVDK